MKKILLPLVALVCSMSINAQVIEVMKNGQIVKTYTAEEVDEVVFEEASEPEYEFIDLGLSVKWATCNIGASTPEEYGLYFAWGETTGYGRDASDGRTFDWTDYKWSEANGPLTKYNTSPLYGIQDNKAILDLEDDAANVNWGGKWRMPTKPELDELLNSNNCTWTSLKQNGVNGYKVTSKINGNSIFLPFAGYRTDRNSHTEENCYGYYWSSWVWYGSVRAASILSLEYSKAECSFFTRTRGHSIRAVHP